MISVRPLVIDTNIILDCFIFADPHYLALTRGIVKSQIDWIATQAMHDEYLRTLSYPAVLRRREKVRLSAFDENNNPFIQYARLVDETTPSNRYKCKDPDDQKFIDLAIAHHAILLSKDKAVLALAAKLHHVGVFVSRSVPVELDETI